MKQITDTCFTATVFRRIYDLTNEAWSFVNMRGTSLQKFTERGWISGFIFLVVTQHVNDFNLHPKGK
jgi:hypothetical protein